MSLWSRFAGGIRALAGQRQSERDMDEELRGYLEAAAAAKMRAGMDPAQARREARVEMGSLESVKDEIRGAGWETAVEAFWRDIHYSVRVLGKSPLFTAVVVLTLALGIGANTAIFSLLDAILLRYLPVAHPEELVQIGTSSITNPLWEQLRDRQDVFSGVLAWNGRDRFNLNSGGAVDYANGLWVSGDYFRTLGLRPAAGRLLTTADDRRGCAATAVLGYAFWQAHYGGAESAIGQAISLNGGSFQIVGVAPAGFFGLDVGKRFDVAIPICSAPVFDGPQSRLDARSWWWLYIVGRKKPGLGLARINARLATLSPGIYGSAVPGNWDSKSQDKFRKRVMEAFPAATGLSRFRKQYEQPLDVLMAVVGLVLLIACANIASLLLARAAARGKEMALRQALGASRLRLVRQLLVESVLLSLAGAALGLLFARWGNLILVHYLSTVRDAAFLDFSPDGRVLAFTAAIAIFAGLLFGVVPAIRGTRASLTAAIKEGSASHHGSRGRFRLWIVGSQVALSLVLLVTAGLLLRSFRNLATLDIGFDRNQILLVNANLGTAKVPAAQYEVAADQIEAALRTLPGVTSLAQSRMTPLSGTQWDTFIQSDVPNTPSGDDADVYFHFISPTYFETLRTPMLAGRNFTRADTATSPQVAIVNQTVARRFFPGVNPVGRTYRASGEARKLEPPVEVIGVVKDAKYESVREETYPTVFRPLTQAPASPAPNFELRTAATEAAMRPAIQESIGRVNKAIPIEIHTLAAQVDDTMTRERLLAALSAFFGALALLLAMIGLYGTLSYLVAGRRVEFGIRMALGARGRVIVSLVMRDVLALVAGGVAGGIAISLATSRLLGTLLFGLAPRDAATLAMAAALLAAVSFAASFLAARRATKIDPMVALRHE